MDALTQLIKTLSRIPGMGRKSAARVAYFLLNSDQVFNQQLSQQIGELKQRIINCSICGRYTESSPCPICSDPTRDESLICVVEEARDVENMESTREFKGHYHVLGGTISPLDGVGPDQLNIASLVSRLEKGKINEVIIATNPTVEGDTTAFYLSQEIKKMKIQASRLASGLPVGGDLEYADRLTLTRSLKGRTPIL